MFGWLRSWLASWLLKRDDEDMEWDLYKPKERKVYRFFDGEKEILADPMLLYKRFMDVAPEMRISWKVARSPSKDATKAHNDLIGNIRRIFELKPLAEGGLSEPEVEDLLDHFLIYVERIKKNSRPSATSPAATSPSTEPSLDDASNTPNGSGTGSTESECKKEPPGQSPTESLSPSV